MLNIDRLLGLDTPSLHINGFSIEDKDLPSNVFYNRHKMPERTEEIRITGESDEPTIADLEEDQQELRRLFVNGEMDSASYQREWQALEDQIKKMRAVAEKAEAKARRREIRQERMDDKKSGVRP